MLHLIIENIRTFVGHHDVPIAPLTILVGENSTGKSSFLATLAAVTDAAGFPFAPAFNRPPYQLGNYDTIATYKGGKFGRARTFSIGFRDDAKVSGRASSALATYRGRDGQPELAEFTIDGAGSLVRMTFEATSGRGVRGQIAMRAGRFEDEIPFTLPRAAIDGRLLSFPDLLVTAFLRADAEVRDRRIEMYRRLSELLYRLSPVESESIAPIRTKPERTYGATTEEYTPGGDQIPFVLERLLRDESSKDSTTILAALERFGREAGLFGALRIRKLGSKAGEPFQVMVNIAGRDRNVVDVGYGVSQALPVVVQSALSSQQQLLLIQQPEVHLHPRAQAALGSFLADLVADAGRRFVIESHSDFIIDRVRQEVAKGKLNAKDVRILFFERVKFDTTVHELHLDKAGNITNAPPSYRSFFLHEELNLLSRGAR